MLSERRRRSSLLGRVLASTGAFLVALAVAATPARAQAIDEATRSSARVLAVEGSELYERGEFEQAHDRFSRAYALVHLPTVGIWAARSLVKLGRLVEASERFLEIQRQPLVEDGPPELEKARADAAAEREALLPRIPALRVLLEGATPSDVFVTLNGELLPSELIGVARPVNPGRIIVKGTRGSDVAERTLDLAEGAAADTKLVFQPLAKPRPPPPPAPSVVPEPPPAADASNSAATQRIFGYSAIGVGGAGIVVGAVFGILGIQQSSELDAACPNRSCGPDQYDELDSYETKRTVASVGLIAGTALAAGGLLLVVTAADQSGRAALQRQRRIGLAFGLGEARLVGELP